METKVYPFKEAIHVGYNPSEYVYNIDVPLGVYPVRLDYKIWSEKSLPAICCYCTVVEMQMTPLESQISFKKSLLNLKNKKQSTLANLYLNRIQPI